MPGGALQIIVQRHVAVVDAGLARKIRRPAWAIAPGAEALQHVLSIGKYLGLAVHLRRRHAAVGAFPESKSLHLML